jgi:L-fuconolactonase
MTPIIDAHHHVWDLSVRDQDWITGEALAPLRRDFSLDDLRPEASAAGVDATILVQTVAVADETPEFLALAAGADLIAGVVGWVDLTAPDVAVTLAGLRELPGGELLVGIRHQVQGEADPDWLCRADVLRGLRAVADAGLRYDLRTLPHQLPAAVRAATEIPELTFVLDHLSKPPIRTGGLEPWANRLRALGRLPNVACKLSGMATEADPERWKAADLRPYSDIVLEAFGPERVMFGSDWPVCLLAASYGRVVEVARELTSHLSAAEQDAVFGGTAARAYGLGNHEVLG